MCFDFGVTIGASSADWNRFILAIHCRIRRLWEQHQAEAQARVNAGNFRNCLWSEENHELSNKRSWLIHPCGPSFVDPTTLHTDVFGSWMPEWIVDWRNSHNRLHMCCSSIKCFFLFLHKDNHSFVKLLMLHNSYYNQGTNHNTNNYEQTHMNEDHA